MNSSWPVEWAGYEFQPIPESWIRAQTAVDSDQRAGPKLLAVSAASKNDGKELLVRYGEPTRRNVLVQWMVATNGQEGVIPNSLASGSGWARSLRPGRNDPVDDLREVELQHLEELWGSVIHGSGQSQNKSLVTDGGI